MIQESLDFKKFQREQIVCHCIPELAFLGKETHLAWHNSWLRTMTGSTMMGRTNGLVKSSRQLGAHILSHTHVGNQWCVTKRNIEGGDQCASLDPHSRLLYGSRSSFCKAQNASAVGGRRSRSCSLATSCFKSITVH